MISLQTSVENKAAPLLQVLMQRIGPEGRQTLNEAATHPVAVLVRGHIMEAARTRHNTADNIRGGPATRTGHLTKAAESVAEEVSSTEGLVTISSPGFRRALGPVTILPKRRAHLTIPTDAQAYGKTVAEVVREGIKVFRPKGKNFLATSEKELGGWTLRVLFNLVTSATLKHEPELLPAKTEMEKEGKRGVLAELRDILSKAGAAA